MAESLLDKAKKQKTKRNQLVHITDEHVELAVAWAKDEIGLSQVAASLGHAKGFSKAYLMLARSLKQYVKNLPLSLNVDSSDKQKGPE